MALIPQKVLTFDLEILSTLSLNNFVSISILRRGIEITLIEKPEASCYYPSIKNEITSHALRTSTR